MIRRTIRIVPSLYFFNTREIARRNELISEMVIVCRFHASRFNEFAGLIGKNFWATTGNVLNDISDGGKNRETKVRPPRSSHHFGDDPIDGIVGEEYRSFRAIGRAKYENLETGDRREKKNISSKIERNFATIEEFEIHANFKNLEFSRILKIGRTINSPEWMIWFYL